MYILSNTEDVLVERFVRNLSQSPTHSINRSDQGPHDREPTFLLLPQVFHDNKGQHRPCHQSRQDPQNDAHHVVVADSHHRANVMDLSVDGDLNNTGKIIIAVFFLVTATMSKVSCYLH